MAAPSTVEAYLAALPEARRIALEGLRSAVQAAAPEATESTSYGIPTFKDHGRMLVSCAAFKDHYGLYPASAWVVEKLGDELKPYLTGRATVRFPADRPIPTALVTRIVAARLEENAAGRQR